MHAHDIVIFCGILVTGFVCQWIAWRVKLPAILFLLLFGIAAGPVLGLLDPSALLGDLLVPLVSISVAIILFEGSLTLKFSELRGHGAVVRRLVTYGVAVTWITASCAAYYLLNWDAYLSALFGAIVTVSGPTVVMPLLRSVRPTAAVSSVLRWEAILIDPLGAILGLIVFDFIIAAQTAEGAAHATVTVLTIVAAGSALGALGGYIFGLMIRRRLVPDFLREYASLAAVLAIFGAAEAIHGESGLLAVTVMGIWLANMRHVDLEDVLSFKESITLVLVGGLFILLAARLDLAALIGIGTGALTIVLLLQFVAGPLRSFLCSIGSPLTWRERLFVGWVFPRGIVAAAISALFALRLEQRGYAGADTLVPLVFTVIIGTVILQSLTARPLARFLNVAEPEPIGVLIVGANHVAQVIAKELIENGKKVVICDSHYASIQEARMKGIPTLYGSAVSTYADENLDLTGLGTLLSMSRQPGLNELACVRFAEDFGRDHVFTISNHVQGEHDKHKVTGESRGRVLLGDELSLEALQDRIDAGQKLKTTKLSDEFDFEAYLEQHPKRQPVYFTDDGGQVHFPVVDSNFTPKAGWTVTAFADV